MRVSIGNGALSVDFGGSSLHWLRLGVSKERTV